MAVNDNVQPDENWVMHTITDRESPSMATSISEDIGFAVARAENMHVWDTQGRMYLDLTAGSGVNLLGHGDPGLLGQMSKQLHTFVHGGWQLGCPARAELSERLADLLPWPDPMMLYCTTGSEAVEGALKVARAATGRRQILSFLGGYHGKTGGSLGVTANAQLRRDVTDLPVAGLRMPYPAAPNYVTGSAPSDAGATFDYGQDILEHPDFGLDDVAAVIVEIVQGAGGMVAAKPGWLTELREFTRRHGILLVLDEIYTGFGRTGEIFGFSHEGVVPDLVIVGKALGGGLPVSVVTGPRDLMDRLGPLKQTSTFSANPVACAAGTYILDRLTSEHLARQATELGQALVRAVETLRVPDVQITTRGRGLMLGAHLSHKDMPGSDFTKAVVRRLRELGVLTLRGGADGQVIKLTPPLTMSDETVQDFATLLEQAIAEQGISRVRSGEDG